MIVKNTFKKAFTLIEIVVSLAIFSLIIVSIIWIYITSSDILVKSDINRKMQENLKNITSKISEDIRGDGIIGLSTSKGLPYDMVLGANKYKEGTGLFTKSGNKYYLAIYEPTTGDYIRADSTECSDIKSKCVVYRLSTDVIKSGPLTNSFVSIKDLKFYLSVEKNPKISMTIISQPSIKKGVKVDLIEQSKIIFQTTISERPF